MGSVSMFLVNGTYAKFSYDNSFNGCTLNFNFGDYSVLSESFLAQAPFLSYVYIEKGASHYVHSETLSSQRH